MFRISDKEVLRQGWRKSGLLNADGIHLFLALTNTASEGTWEQQYNSVPKTYPFPTSGLKGTNSVSYTKT